MKTLNATVTAIMLSISSAASASEVPVLGLSVGGKFPAIRECKIADVGTDKVMCWLDAPSTSKGSKAGNINLPGADSRPKWAAYSLFHATTDDRGMLKSLGVLNKNVRSYGEIVASISSRFGPATNVFATTDHIQTARWDSSPIRIEVLCAPNLGCKVDFSALLTPAELRASKAFIEKENKRPVGP